jgi:hypothetical protein
MLIARVSFFFVGLAAGSDLAALDSADEGRERDREIAQLLQDNDMDDDMEDM